MMNEPIFRLNAGLFYAAHMFVSSEPTRYYLHGVYVEPHPEQGVNLTATDGRQIVMVHDRDGMAKKPAILTLDRRDLARLKPVRGKNGNTFDNLVIRESDGLHPGQFLAEIRDKSDTIKSIMLAREIDGTFPDYRRVVPTYAPDRGTPETYGCMPHQLAAFASAGTLIGIALDISFTDPAVGIALGGTATTPSLISFGPAQVAFAILAPTRVTCHTSPPPWFVPHNPDAPAQAEQQVA